MLTLITAIAPRRSPLTALFLMAGALFAAPIRADEADDQFAVAAGHYAQQRWKLAVEEFQAFLEKHPNHANTYQGVFFLAEAQLQMENLTEAEARFREYLEGEPDGKLARAALFRAGEAAYLSGKPERARADLEKFRSTYPQDKLNAYVLPYLGEIALGQGQPAAAARQFRAGLNRFPQGRLQDDCRFGLARALERQNLGEEAERLYLAVAAKAGNPLADDAQFHLGALQYATGKYAQANQTFTAFENRLSDSPWKPNARLGRGWALLKLKQPERAQPVFQSISSDPKVGLEARYWLGLAQRAQKQWAAAAETLLAVAEAAPQHELIAAVRFQAGDALMRAGNAAAASEQFDRVIASASPAAGGTASPADGGTVATGNRWVDDALRGKLQAALQTGDHQTLDRVAAEFDRRFPQSPLRRDVQRIRARSLVQRKQHGPAVKLLERLMAGDAVPPAAGGRRAEPDLEARYLLALAYQGLGRYEDALAALLPVVDSAVPPAAGDAVPPAAGDAVPPAAGDAVGPLKSDAQLVQGSLLMALRRYEDAVEPLEAFLASNPTSPPAAGGAASPAAGGAASPAAGGTDDQQVKGRGELAICYARSGRLDKAKAAYADLLQRHPRHKLVLPVTEQLAEVAYEAGDNKWSARLFRRLMTDSGQYAHGRSKEYELKGMAGLGWSQLKGGQLAEAALTFEKLLQSSPPAAIATEAAMVRGRIFEQLDQSDPALAMYDIVIDKYPHSADHPKALLAAARLRDKLQQEPQSAALYERLATDYPDLPQIDAVLYEWAWVLSDMGKTAASSAMLQRLRKEHPQSRYRADATYRLAQRALAAKDYSRASELASQLLSDKPDGGIREHALYLQGQIAVTQQDWHQVRQAFETLAKEFPDSPSRLVAEYWVAETAYRLGDYRTAGRLFNRLAQRTQGRRDAWLAMIPLRRAQVLAQLDKWKEAYVLASKIEAEFPDFQQQYEADYLIGRCLASGADFQGARDAYLKVIRSPAGAKTETAAMAQWMIGETYFHQDNHAAALREYLKVEILYAFPTWQAAALLQAGKCRDLLGESKEADNLYARLMKQYPRTRFAEEAARRMGIPPSERGGLGQPD